MGNIHIPEGVTAPEGVTGEQEAEKSVRKECCVCLLISSADNKVDYFFTDYDFYLTKDKYICEHCLNDIKLIRKLINKKLDNPAQDIINDFFPWYIEQIPEAKVTWGKMNILV